MTLVATISVIIFFFSLPPVFLRKDSFLRSKNLFTTPKNNELKRFGCKNLLGSKIFFAFSFCVEFPLRPLLMKYMVILLDGWDYGGGVK